MSNTKKQATKDAVEYARAQLFFGEGAGIRRRIIEAKVTDQVLKDPKYAEAFDKALGEQSWSEHAEKAVKERKRLDRGKSLSKNTRAVLTGRPKNASSNVIIALALVGYFAHQNGYDKVALAEAKKQYQKGKSWVKYKYHMYKARPTDVTHNVTNITNP